MIMIPQEVALSVASLVERLDLPEENIQTLLCYLEDYSPPLVQVSNHVYCQARVQVSRYRALIG